MKVAQAANKVGMDPKAFCDKVSGNFKELARLAGIEYTHFVRTTDGDHQVAVHHLWNTLQDNGYIYKGLHEGWYSVSDETFYPESSVEKRIVDGTERMVSTETGTIVEWHSEENYHFRLSAMRDPLLKFYKENPGWVYPSIRFADIITAVQNGLTDLSISRPRSRLSWGIPVPGDEEHTIYVWLDALTNYLTKAGYPWSSPNTSEYEGGWPADIHVIGKDILKFHCIYWPAFLLAASIPLPRHILTHGHWTMNGSKMSKSRGNVVDPVKTIQEEGGAGALRWFLLRSGGFDADRDYTHVEMGKSLRELRNQIGNLNQRINSPKKWNITESIANMGGPNAKPMPTEKDDVAFELRQEMDTVMENVKRHMDNNEVDNALKSIMNLCYTANAYVQVTAPWSIAKQLKKNDAAGENVEALKPQFDDILYNAAEALRITAILLQPFLPDKAEILLDMWRVPVGERELGDAVFGKGGYGPEKGVVQPVLFPYNERELEERKRESGGK
ncbi:methionyl-tRNA synthetase [Saitoella coloradoensis]